MRNQRSRTRNDRKSKILPLLSNVIPQIPALQRRTWGEPAELQKQTQKEKGWIQQIIPKGALLLWTLSESKALLEGSLHQCHSWRIKTLGSTGQVPSPQPTLTCTRTNRNCFYWAQIKPPKQRFHYLNEKPFQEAMKKNFPSVPHEWFLSA